MKDRYTVYKTIVFVACFVAVFCFTAGGLLLSNDTNMTLKAGMSYRFNAINKTNNVDISNTTSLVGKQFDYVNVDRNGSVVSYGQAGGKITVDRAGYTLVTVLDKDIEIAYPKDDVSVIEVKSAALERVEIAEGKTLVLQNADIDRAYAIKLNGAGFVSYDGVYTNSVGTVLRFAAGETSSEINVPEGGKAIITPVKKTAISVDIPSPWAKSVTAKQSDSPAIYAHSLASSQSLQINNADPEREQTVNVSNDGGYGMPVYDIVRRDINDKVIDFTREAYTGEIKVPAGGNVTVTANAANSMRVWFPHQLMGTDLNLVAQLAPALYVQTVSVGSSVTITNADEENMYRIATNSSILDTAPRFDYNIADVNGYVFTYGTEDLYDGFDLNPRNTIHITVKNGYNLRVWYPSEYKGSVIKTEATDAKALMTYDVDGGMSVNVANSDDETFSVSAKTMGQVITDYEYLCKDKYNQAISFGTTSNATTDVYPEGQTMITAANGYKLRLYYPTNWSNLSIEPADGKALHYYDVSPNYGLEIAAGGNENDSFYIGVENAEKSNKPIYEYLNDDMIGCADTEAAMPERLMLTGGEKMQISAYRTNRLRVFIPTEQKDNVLTVKTLERPVLTTMTLPSGKGIIIKNDGTEERKLITNSEMERIGLESVSKNKDGTISSWSGNTLVKDFRVSAGGQTVVTAVGSGLKIFVPTDWIGENSGISFTESDSPAVYYATIPAGGGLKLTNLRTDMSFNIPVYDINDGISYDKLILTSDGTVRQCVTDDTAHSLYLETGGTSSISARNGSSVKMLLPYEWKDSIQIENTGTVLTQFTVKPGDSIEIENTDLNYGYAVYTNANPNNGMLSPVYDLVFMKGDKAQDFSSENKADVFSVLNAGRTLLTVNEGSELKLWYPAENAKKLSIKPSAQTALMHYTVSPGATLTIYNNSETAYQIRNNSGDGLHMPKYEYRNNTTTTTYENPVAISGPVAVPPHSSITIRAVNGYDLKLWVPQQWLREISVR